MKGSLKLRPKRVLTRKEAWACFTANLAIPGSGSLAAGRAIGYCQMAAAFLAMALSIVASLPMFKWWLSGAAAAAAAASETAFGDPFEYSAQVWQHIRGPLAGIGLFVAAVLWAMMTSRDILTNATKDGVPPRIG